MSDWSKHSKYSEIDIPRQKKTLPIWGANEDTGKYFRCWNCGFIANKDRNQIEFGNYGRSGIRVLDFPGYNPDLQMGNEQGIAILEDNHVCMRNGLDDSADTVQRHDHYPDTFKGCPLCGSTNYR